MKATKKIALFLAVLTIMAVLAMPLSVSAANVERTATAKEIATLNLMVEAANLTIEGLVKVAQYTPYNDVPYLLYAVDRIVASVLVARAGSIGGLIVNYKNNIFRIVRRRKSNARANS